MNNFSELTDGDSTKFLVRWRGRQEGPHLASVIEAKLAANEIGLLHEIFYNGQWVTLRDYIANKESVILAEHLAKEEYERTEEEKKKQLAQWQSQSHDELFAEEKRNDALLKSTAERNVKNEWRAPSQKNTTLIYSVSFVVVLIIAIGAYTFIHIKAQAAALEAARLQAEAIKAATKAQENAAAINAAASVVNTVVNAAVEANKPAPVIINNK